MTTDLPALAVAHTHLQLPLSPPLPELAFSAGTVYLQSRGRVRANPHSEWHGASPLSCSLLLGQHRAPPAASELQSSRASAVCAHSPGKQQGSGRQSLAAMGLGTGHPKPLSDSRGWSVSQM